MDAVCNANHCHPYPYFQCNAFPTGYINITQIWPGLWARQMLDQWKDKQIVDYEKIVRDDAIKSGRDLGKRWSTSTAEQRLAQVFPVVLSLAAFAS